MTGRSFSTNNMTGVSIVFPGTAPLPRDFQRLFQETTVAGAASVTYWNFNLSEFAQAPPAPKLQEAIQGEGSAEAGQITVQGEL